MTGADTYNCQGAEIQGIRPGPDFFGWTKET